MNIFTGINSSLRRLSHIKRYSSFQTIRPENVAEHSFYCVFYAHLLVKDLIDRGFSINENTVIKKALYHDFEESMTGDIIRTFKHSNDDLAREIEAAGDKCMKELSLEFGSLGEGIYDAWRTAKDGSLEGSVVDFADLLCVVAYCREEILLGNSHFHAVAHQVYFYMNTYRDHELFGKYIADIYPNNDPFDIKRELELTKHALRA